MVHKHCKVRMREVRLEIPNRSDGAHCLIYECVVCGVLGFGHLYYKVHTGGKVIVL